MRSIKQVFLAGFSALLMAAAPAPFLPPGGIDPSTRIGTSASTIQTVTDAANASIPTSYIGTKIPEFDVNGYLPYTIATPNGAYIHKLGTSNATFGKNYKLTFFDQMGDYPTSPDTVICGGHTDTPTIPDNCYLKIIGGTTSHGDQGGSVVSIYNQGNPFGSLRNGAGSTDGIDLFMAMGDKSPQISLGQDITSNDGIVYKVKAFGADYVDIYPQLSAKAKKSFNPYTRIYTNWKNRNTFSRTTEDHPFITPDLYYSYYASMADITATDGTKITRIHVQYNPDNGDGNAGWTRETLNGTSRSPNLPGAGTNDILDDTTNTSLTDNTTVGLDFSYKHPAIFVGALGNSLFDENIMNTLNYPKDSTVRAMKGKEWDYELNLRRDYDIFASGLVMNFNTSGHRLADGSAGIVIGGTGIPVEIEAGGDAESTMFSSYPYEEALWVGAIGIGNKNSNAADYHRLLSIQKVSMGPNSDSGQLAYGHYVSNYHAIRRMHKSTANAPANNFGDFAFEDGIGEDVNTPKNRDNSPGGNFKAGYDAGKIVYWNNAYYVCPDSSKFTAASQSGCTMRMSPTDTLIKGSLSLLYNDGSNDSTMGHPWVYADSPATISWMNTTGVAVGQSMGTLYAKGDSDFDRTVAIHNGSTLLLEQGTKSAVGVGVGLASDPAGTLDVNTEGGDIGGISISGVPLSSLNAATKATKLPRDGSQNFCNDCKLHNIKGVAVIYHSSTKTWTDMMNNTLSN